MTKKEIKKIIKEWVKDNYGQDEVNNPSWDIDSLSERIENEYLYNELKG